MFSPLKKIKIVLLATALFLLLGTQVQAISAGDVGQFVGDLFQTGEDGISFTQYQGELAQLSEEGYDPSLVASSDIREFIIRIVNFALGFLGLIAVIIVIYGGVLYVTSGGDDDRTQTGKKAIQYAVIGLLIVLGSFAFVNTVIRGAQGEIEGGGSTIGVTGVTSPGYNASSEQIRALALDIYQGYAFLEEATQTFRDIQSEATRESLEPDNLPGKNAVLNFLRSTESRLKNLNSRLQPFSIAETRINDFIREIDQEIDSIERLGSERFVRVRGVSIEYCDPDQERGFGDGLAGDSDAKVCGEEGYNSEYIVGLYERWRVINEKYADVTTYTSLVGPVAEDYALTLRTAFQVLDDIYNNFQNIDAIQGQGSQAKAAYESMMSAAGYGYQVNGNTVSATAGGFLADVNNWSIESSVDTSGQKLLYGLENQSILYNEISQLQFVNARLTANVVQGSAPLAVIFDTLGTADPAGGSILGDNITWDLAGTRNTSEFLTVPPGQVLLPADGSVTCSFNRPAGEDESDFVGNTSKRCVFHKPGTYTAAIKVNSNEPTSYAPGISVLTIKVNPPTTQIELEVEAGGQKQTVIHYENDVLFTDRQKVTVTTNDAETGITFDASGTQASQFAWDFGDGTTTEFTSNSVEVHEYEEPGVYEVKLEVVNAIGVKDSKIFSLEISSIAARLYSNPRAKSNVNSPVTFDAGESKSDLGRIVNYEWLIRPSANQNIPAQIQEELNQIYPMEESGANLETYTHEFRYPLNYDISVTVTDDARNQDTDTILGYNIESQPPVAAYTYEIPNQSQPGTVHFSAVDSYDPDGDENFDFEWTIEPEDGWELVEPFENGLGTRDPIVKFLEEGRYDVTLNVTDFLAPDEQDDIMKTIDINNVLDVDWAEEQEVTATLDDDGIVEVDFIIESENAIAYEIDFGDGLSDSGDISGRAIISHTYSEGGRYNVEVNVYDEDDNSTSLQRRFFVGGGDDPIARISLEVNNEEILDLGKVVTVTKSDVLTFDASESKNIDGTGRNLNYSWDFGDTERSSQREVTHQYRELSPQSTGYYEVKLVVTDDDDPSLSDQDKIRINVVGSQPYFSNIQAIPQTFNNTGDLITPINVNLKAFGVDDEDGQVTKYRWWYFNLNDTDRPLGIQITQSPNTQLTIGTNGPEGQEVTYGFGLEVTDNDNLTYTKTSTDSTVTVVNGPNELPTARFNANATSVFVGDTVTLSSASTDPDGNIIQYVWDLEGDGFFNNEATDQSSIEHVYEEKNQEGYDVRLKVIDDKGGEAISPDLTIYVDSVAENPEAAFKYEPVQGEGGFTVQFTNNTEADTAAGARIIRYEWDFDDLIDSDGDGEKHNDVDSREENPVFEFPEPGAYLVKLTVTDNQGNSDHVVNRLNLPLSQAPTAAFTAKVVDGRVVFQNNSTADLLSGAVLEKYEWDFDTQSELTTADSDGDGEKDNDVDSQLREPVHQYQETGTYTVRLKVYDSTGNSDEVTNEVTFSRASDSGRNLDDPINSSGLKAVLLSDPVANSQNVVNLSGSQGSIKFDFSKSVGPIAYYTIDKNIYFDTDGDGIKNNDKDFRTSLPGTWKTNFNTEWGRTVVKLTVMDIYGNENSSTIEVKFN